MKKLLKQTITPCLFVVLLMTMTLTLSGATNINVAMDPIPTPYHKWDIHNFPCYLTVEETYAEAGNLAAQYPELAQWIDIGDSWEKTAGLGGYDIMALILTNTAITGDKPKLLITGAMHAQEMATTQLALDFAKQLVMNYDANPEARLILDHHEVHIVLSVNPDGRKHAEKGENWRKNTNQSYGDPDSPLRGVDINRNFSYGWNGPGTHANPYNRTYRGPSPASEPETQVLEAYMKSLFPDYNGENPSAGAPQDAAGLYIDLHSYSGLILYPWGSTPEQAPNAAGLDTLAHKFAYWNNYTPNQTYNTWPKSGNSDDYAYGELGVAAYYFELGTAFHEDCTTYEGTILPDNLPVLMYAAKAARAPYMISYGPDAVDPVITGGTLLQVEINDNRSKSDVSADIITEAEYYIDTPPWAEGAVSYPMYPVDGVFDNTIETFEANIDITGLSAGEHMVYVRGRDVAGNWGAVSATFLTVIATPTPTPSATPVATPPGINIAVNKPVSVSSASFQYPGQEANDDNTDTYWLSGRSGSDEWITVDLLKVKKISSVQIIWKDEYYATDYSIAGSPNDTLWKTLEVVNNGDGDVDTFTLKDNHRYIKIILNQSNTDGLYGIKELRVFTEKK